MKIYIVAKQPHCRNFPTLSQMIYFRNKKFDKFVIEPNQFFGVMPFVLGHIQFSLHPPLTLLILYFYKPATFKVLHFLFIDSFQNVEKKTKTIFELKPVKKICCEKKKCFR